MDTRILGPVVAFLCIAPLAAQAPSFDVASIRENRAGHIGPAGAQRVQMTGGTRAHLVNVPLRTIIAIAFHVSPDDVEGGPSWIRSTSFDIDARVEQPVSAPTMRLMLQALLRERFTLAVRDIEVPGTGAALVLANPERGPGPKLVRVEVTCQGLRSAAEPGVENPCGLAVMPDHNTGNGFAMEVVAVQLGATLRLSPPVLNETGLTGLWRWDVRWSRAWRDDPFGVSPEVAIEEQLGLKLVERTIPVPTIVVESVSRPIEN
ncbi:MAG: TIGR03435 family protein [Vicinamibacterales bacterium]